MEEIANMSGHTHADVMQSLMSKHSILLDLIGQRGINYLDLPFHGNVGDLLIMLGTVSFFEKNKLPVIRKGMYFNFSSSFVQKDEIVLLHGGGNFGDIYGPFQSFRERIISDLPDNRIVILPQTIHFSDQNNFDKCCNLFSKHQDLHICVRDRRSYGLAQMMTKNVYLMPDMAHQLWPVGTGGAVQERKPLLVLKRRDSEAVDNGLGGDCSTDNFDWDDLIGKSWIYFLSNFMERSMYHANRFGLNYPFMNLESNWWIWQSKRFVKRATELFGCYEAVESDRLHAHILSCLMSIPNKIHDNSYGKNSSYIMEWTKDSPLVELVK